MLLTLLKTMAQEVDLKNKYSENNSTTVPIPMSKYLFICSAKFVIEKSVRQVLHVYPHFET